VTLDEGDVAVVDTLSHQGLVNGADPMTFLTGLGVDRSEVLPDAEAAYASVHRPEGADSHLLTGPIAVSGAVPGDAVRIDLLGAELRSPYGINIGRPGRGLLPDLLEEDSLRLLRLDASGTRVTFAPGLSIPVAPFPGFVATTPPEVVGAVGTRVPGPWGGNLDLRILTAGSSLILPVNRAGALLWIGDPHAVQGHGEVNGTAVEQSARFEVRVTRLPGAAPSCPVAMTDGALVATGIAVDPAEALRDALRNAIDLLLGWTRGRLSRADAYALCSIAGDLGLAEVVNGAAVAYLALPLDVITDGPS
jgi:acetamidase/formamidase